MLAEVVRSGFAESRHRVSVVVLGEDGRPVQAAGQVTAPMFPRSVNKPMQAAVMLRAGLDLDGRLLALAAASHSGQEFHVAGARQILASAGLAERHLQCPPALPLDKEAAWRTPVIRRLLSCRRGMDRLYHNCSGKHAAMLATCVHTGWPTDSYLDPQHPLQQELRRALGELAGEPVRRTGVDGCGAPLFALSLTGVARGLHALVSAPPRSPERRVADAMRGYPAWTSGSHRPERELMAAVPGLLFKVGAEGVGGIALADGRTAVFKIEDGSDRPRAAVTVALLRWLGVGGPGPDAELARLGEVPVIGGERRVGSVRITLPW